MDKETFDHVPEMVVFDLDACSWTPEMFELDSKPSVAVRGRGDKGEDLVVGARAGRDTVTLFPGALHAFRELATNPIYKNTKVAAASSTTEPDYARSAMSILEIFPGVTMGSIFHYKQIGCSGLLSHRKTSHFTQLQKESGVAFCNMLFFDDCGYSDHVGDINRQYGVVGHRTPHG
jgi:magnesium-dependent phosphatase 1